MKKLSVIVFIILAIGLQIWSTKLLIKFYAATVFGAIAQTDYEGEISRSGDKVIIRTVPNITIRDYVKKQKLTYTEEESAPVELNIDKGKYFAFPVNAVDKKQADVAYVDAWADDASQQMKIAIDRDILGNIYADAAAANIGTACGAISSSFNMGTTGSAIALTKSNVIDYIVDAGTVLDEQNLPETDRWLAMPNWATNLIKKSDLQDASLTGDGTSILRNGRIGMIDRFTIYGTNNYTAVSDGGNNCYNICYGHKSALTFASQMTDMETLKNPDDFGDLVRGLNIYGYKVVKATSMGVLYARKG